MKYLLFLSILFLMAACKKENVSTYKGPDGITFYVDEYEVDSLNYSFAYSPVPKNRDTVFLKMRVVGAAADYPRVISVTAGAGSTARQGKDYELPEITLPAGALTVLYPVVLLNSPEMTTTTFRLVAQVAPGKDFQVGATGREIGGTTSLEKIIIDMSNKIIKPSYWDDVESAFGAFSERKFRFMVQVTGLSDFSYDAIGVDGYYNLPVKLQNALAEYEAVNGPMIDESGNEVTF